ncbi:beta-lactamase family protein [Caldibacillus lycopersici]|uniref:Beta-lactamase family protein n=1 Tax=Perspicuibacillus lycopersici TaxID=1325689 RepID=A0AAE3IVD5_9BACI|nr:serine hydrolase domain-containing protein [Perspicuibacillus lycopersici]MCU9614912.1 beta-lactamase family protein [Perspicuibacillus lycopersici]
MKRFAVVFLFLISLSLFTPRAFSADETTTPSGIPMEDLEKFIDDYVADYIGYTAAGASIVVVKDQEIVFSKGYGYGDIANGIPMEANTSILEWGSITKLMVWTSVMQLVEQGKIDLHEDIRNYLPNGFLEKLSYEKSITMLHLMHHTAGYEDNIFDLLISSPNQMTTLEETLKLSEPKQVYPPGEVVAYSNYTTSLAAFIVEQVTGQNFYDYVDEHILSKLHMNQSTIHLPVEEDPDILKNITKGYSLLDYSQFEESVPFYIPMYPSGGMNGTAEDLAKFAIALMPREDKQTPLFGSNQTLQEMLSTSYSVNENVPGNAHGFWEYSGAKRGLFHSGNTVAFSSNLHMVPEENFAVVVLTNQSGEINLSYGLVKALVGEDERMVEDNLPSNSNVEGTYLSARRMMDGFLSLYYYYLTPFHVTAQNENEIVVDAAGLEAIYQQTSPYVYQMTSGSAAFIPNDILYFHVKDGVVNQISTTFSDYLPMDKSNAWLMVTLLLFIFCTVYFLVSSIFLLVRAILKHQQRKPSTTISKWNGLLHLSGTGIIVNIFVLAIRMLTNSNRAYSELYIHFGLNYAFTVCSLLSIVIICFQMKKTALSKWQNTGYLLSMLSIILLIAWMIVWQFYA